MLLRKLFPWLCSALPSTQKKKSGKKSGSRGKKHKTLGPILCSARVCVFVSECLKGSEGSLQRRPVGYKGMEQVLSWVTCLTLSFSIESCVGNSTKVISSPEIQQGRDFVASGGLFLRMQKGQYAVTATARRDVVTQPCEVYKEVNLILQTIKSKLLFSVAVSAHQNYK